MDKKTKIITRRLLLLLAIFSITIAIIEGILFYTAETIYFRILMTVQNAVNMFTFRPSISLRDAMALMQTNHSPLYTVVGYCYGLAVFTAPYCTVSVAYKLMEHMLRLAFGARYHRRDNPIFIFGYNPDVLALVSNSLEQKKSRQCIHIVCAQAPPEEESYLLAKKGCRLHCFDVLALEEKRLHFLLELSGIAKADQIIIFDDDPIRNFSVLQIFSLKEGDGGFRLKKNAKVTCRCEEAGQHELIADYYRMDNGQACAYDLELVSLPEVQVRKLFSDVPLHSYYLNRSLPLCQWHTRLLIIGFGDVGQQVLLQAMTLGVVHVDNHITIDIYDNAADDKMDLFMGRFSPETFEKSGASLRLKSSAADGRLQINWHQTDARSARFADEIRSAALTQPYTYVLVTMDQPGTAVCCAMALSRILNEKGRSGTPIVLRMDSDKRLAKYIETNRRTFADVYLLEERTKAVTLELILNHHLNQMARRFHYVYDNIQVVGLGDSAAAPTDADEAAAWNALPMYKRESSKALAAHDAVKQVILQRLTEELQLSSLHDKLEELLGPQGSLMQYDNGVWRLPNGESAFLQTLSADSFARTIAQTEHRRWCCFVASLGWKNGSVRNDDFKIHTCLVPYDVLLQDPKGRTTIKYDLMCLMARYKESAHP